MAVALRAAAPAVRGMDAAAARVMAKLDPLLPRRSGQRAHAAMASLPAAEADALVDAALLAQLAAACRDRVTLRLDYRRDSGAALTRNV
ncbi:repressor [Xanthomonas bromi]|uniref:Repressor n=1 Tax=Xanthomonas bromi TaxID=56449 RepID=A0A1C3NMN6_9XANT|nr:repressor [Xanthomonas bromi]